MTTEQGNHIVAICLMAGFADGRKDDREREQLRSVVDLLGLSEINAAGIYRDVLLKKISLADAAAALQEEPVRQLAYEMAVLMCDADGAANDQEKAFLGELAVALRLAPASSAETLRTADAIVAQGLLPVPQPPPAAALAPAADLDAMIIRYAVVTAACELIPQTLGSLAILPLQLKMVYRVGKHFGYELDAGHIKDLAAALGIGLSSQMLDGLARKFFGKMGRKMGGSFLGGLAGAAAGSAVTFGTTWALGQLAREYYGGGRKLGLEEMKRTFAGLLEKGKSLQGQYADQITRQAGSLNLADLAQGKVGI